MNYEKLTRKLLESCAVHESTIPMDSLLPSYLFSAEALDHLMREYGTPAYYQLLDTLTEMYSPIIKRQLEKGDDDEL